MSEFPPPSSGAASKSPAFADALQRARQIASKIKPNEGGPPPSAGSSSSLGLKRPLDPGPELDIGLGGPPEIKKPAALNDPFGAQLAARQQLHGGNMMGEGEGPPATDIIMVPDKMVGLIIGRGGEQITRLQAESGCKIQMAQDSQGMSERQCTLTGPPSAIQQARQSIERIIANEGTGAPRGGGGPMGGGPGGPMGGPGGPGGGMYEMLVPGHKVGLIIGKGGETIKQLQERSGAKIVIIQDSPEAATEKPLRITGPPDNVEAAKQMVADILNQNDERDMGFGGRGRGRGRGGGRGGFMGGRGGARGGGRGGYGASQWGGGPPGGGGSEYGAEHTDYVPIPSNKCGLIIGKGGETIKSINQTTGAHCEVDKNAPQDAREKNFIIRGPPEAVERAKAMIMEKLGMQPGGYGGGGYGGGPGGSGGSWGGQYQGGGGGGYQQDSSAAVSVNPQTGQPDYSAQWAEYYRSMGMTREAEAIEQQGRAAAPAPAAPAPAANGAQNGGVTDYSVQWAEYYRSIGKVKEAEAIEAQMKQKAATSAPGGQGYPAANAQYGGYYGGQAPGAAPGAPASSYPGYAAAAGYPAYGGQPTAES